MSGISTLKQKSKLLGGIYINMTVPVERTNAVIYTEQFLIDLLDPKKTPRVPKSIREQAGHLLRHYPSKFHMETIAAKEDGEPQQINVKIFGKSYL